MLRTLWTVGVGFVIATGGTGVATAEPEVIPAGWRNHPLRTPLPPCPPSASNPTVCPPSVPAAPVIPGTPLAPNPVPVPSPTPAASPEIPPPFAQTLPTPDMTPALSPMDPTPAMDLLAQGTERGAQPVAAFRDMMFGDLLGISASLNVYPNGQYPVGAAQAIANQLGRPVTVRAPLSARHNGYRIGDNESPAPQDRVSFSYNYYYGVNQSRQPEGFPRLTAQRQSMGFEKTFLDGNFSIGLRQPFVQIYGDSLVNGSSVSDLSIIFKGRIWSNPDTGNLISGGLVVTAPTGVEQQAVVNGVVVNPASTLFQPFLGFISLFDRGYTQGFGSIVVPNRSNDTMIVYNSLGAGYWLYREPENRYLTGITPVVELHVSTPLNNRSPTGLLFFQDQVNITTGSYFSFRRLLVGTAFGIPTVSPQPWNFEWILNMNYRF